MPCAVPTCAGVADPGVPFPAHNTLKIRWIRAIVAGTGLDLAARHPGTVCSWHFADESSAVGYWEPVRFLHCNGKVVSVANCRFCQRFDEPDEMVPRSRLLRNEDLAFVLERVVEVNFSEDDLFCKRCNTRLEAMSTWIDECRTREDEFRKFVVAAKEGMFSIVNKTNSVEFITEIEEIDEDPLMLNSDEDHESNVEEVEEEFLMPEPMVVKVEEDIPIEEPLVKFNHPPNIPAKRGRHKRPPKQTSPNKLRFRDVLMRKCYICDSLHDSHEDLVAHLSVTHPDRSTFHCADCDKHFKVVTAFNRHLGFHDREHRPLKCSFCPMGFSDPTNVQRHENRHHGAQHHIRKQSTPQERAFPCTSCDKAFRTNHDLVEHDRFVHQRLPGAICKLCGKHLRDRTSLKKHQLVHTGDKPYGCERCESAFKSTWQLARHVANHHPEKKAQCQVCCETFKSKTALRDHIECTHLADAE